MTIRYRSLNLAFANKIYACPLIYIPYNPAGLEPEKRWAAPETPPTSHISELWISRN
jgi:hypothetical protein